MARDERKLLEDIALDIAKSDYGFKNDLITYMETVRMIQGLSDTALVDYICK